MKTKLLRKIRKRFTIIDYKHNLYMIKWFNHQDKTVNINSNLVRILANFFNYSKLNKKRQYNREIRKLTKQHLQIKR